MSEYELVDLSFNAMGQVMESIGYFITILFAYLAVAYVAGSQLSKLEILIVSVLFLFGALLFAYSTYGYMTKHFEIVQAMQAISPDKQYFNNTYTRSAVVGGQLFGILTSLIFMYGRAKKRRAVMSLPEI